MMVIASGETMQPPGQDKLVPSWSRLFDAGAAWGYLALQATKLGWYAHAMVGFDRDRAFAGLGFPPGHGVEAAVAQLRLEGLARRLGCLTCYGRTSRQMVENPSRSPCSKTGYRG